MGKLVEGVWQPGPIAATKAGSFARPDSQLRDRIGTAAHPIAPDRYHLYVAYACPWAHRTLITRALRGLEDVVGVTVVDPHMGDQGWELRPTDPDPYGAARYLYEIYARSDARYTGKVTVPVLWDRVTQTIVNNESREIMRMLDVDLAPLARDPAIATLAPEPLRPRIDATLDAIYTPINNGVYRAGFASTQDAYASAATELFAALAHWDAVLGTQPWMCGDVMTEADIAMFTTCLRFDLVYYSHFKCNLRSLRDHTNLWRLVRTLWQHPKVRPTCQLDDIKTHYYWSQAGVNPTRIVPLGPDLVAALDAPIA